MAHFKRYARGPKVDMERGGDDELEFTDGRTESLKPNVVILPTKATTEPSRVLKINDRGLRLFKILWYGKFGRLMMII